MKLTKKGWIAVALSLTPIFAIAIAFVIFVSHLQDNNGNALSPAQVVGAILFLLLVALSVIAGIGLYFLPTIVAILNKHHQTPAIFTLNLFAFTGVGWIIALVWVMVRSSEARGSGPPAIAHPSSNPR